MIENLDERKKQIVQYYENEYAPKPKKWWQGSSGITYRPTRELYDWSSWRWKIIQEKEIIIRYNKKEAIKSIASFLFIIAVIIVSNIKNVSADNVFGYVIFLLFLIPVFRQIFDRKPRLIFYTDGITSIKPSAHINWENVVASYIKKDSSGDSVSYYLLIHYYDEQLDQFGKIEIDIQSLDMEYEDIAAYLEVFKQGKAR